MTTPTGMAIDPSLVFSGQYRPGPQQQQQQTSPSAGGSMLKQENDTPQQQQHQQREQDNHDGSQNYNNMSTDAHMSQDPQSTTLNGSTSVKPEAEAEAEQQQQQQQPLEMPLDLTDDAELAAFLARMDEYEPILPDSVTRFYLEKAGFQSSDDRVTRMLGLAAQKFVSDIAKDAYAFARTRTTAGPGRNTINTQGTSSKNKDRTRTVLTMDDLSAALHEYGVDASRAPYYR